MASVEKEVLKKQINDFCNENYNENYDFSQVEWDEEIDEASDEEKKEYINEQKLDYLHEIEGDFYGYVWEKFFDLNIIKDKYDNTYNDFICEEVWQWLTNKMFCGDTPEYNPNPKDIVIRKKTKEYIEGTYFGQSYKIDLQKKEDILGILANDETEEVINTMTQMQTI